MANSPSMAGQVNVGGQSPVFLPFNPQIIAPTKGYLEALDSRKDIERIRHALRREQEIVEKDGSSTWEPTMYYQQMEVDRRMIKEDYTSIDKFLESYGHPPKYPAYVSQDQGEILQVMVPIPSRPMVSSECEHDLVARLTSMMTLNIKLSNMPSGDGERGRFVDRMTQEYGAALINYLGANSIRYEIDPHDLMAVYFIVIPNVYASLMLAVGGAGRNSGEKILSEATQHADLPPMQGGR